ncbi:MAG: hypothetical protein ABSA30_00070 [Candidatus Aminicenantales bacterium]|jgi:hypothetical protein
MTVHFIAPWYEYYPILADSLRLQTVGDWTLDLIHDGPETQEHCGEWRDDPRITIRHSAVRYNDWGHSLRAEALERLKTESREDKETRRQGDKETADQSTPLPVSLSPCLPLSPSSYVVITNADNYYVPPFLAAMLELVRGHRGAYCDCVHSHFDYRCLPAALEFCRIDCGCLLVETALAVSVGWRGRHFEADWQWIADLLAVTGDFVHLPRPLFVHN